LNKTKNLSAIKKLNPTRIIDLIKTDQGSFHEYQGELNLYKQGFDLSNSDMSHSKISNITFRSSKICNSTFSFSKFTSVTFVDCDLTCANFRGAEFYDCHFFNCNLNLVKLENTLINHVFIYSSDFRSSDLSRSSVENLIVHSCKMSNSKIDCCTINRSIFIESNLNNVSIMGSDLFEESVFYKCENLPKSVTSKINLEIHDLKTKGKTFDMSKDDAIQLLNRKKLEDWDNLTEFY